MKQLIFQFHPSYYFFIFYVKMCPQYPVLKHHQCALFLRMRPNFSLITNSVIMVVNIHQAFFIPGMM